MSNPFRSLCRSLEASDPLVGEREVDRWPADALEQFVELGLLRQAEQATPVRFEHWDRSHKGIDDAIAAGVEIEVVEGGEAVAFLHGVARRHDNRNGTQSPGSRCLGRLVFRTCRDLLPGQSWTRGRAGRMQGARPCETGQDSCHVQGRWIRRGLVR